MRLLSPRHADGPWHMALDEALLQETATTTLRCYTWRQATLSLGCFQDHALVTASLPFPVPAVRRITGGGAIWHADELTYCLVGRLGQDGLPTRSRDLYPLLHGAIRAEVQRHGIALERQDQDSGDRRYRAEPRCFASPAADDLLVGGAKTLGSAARVRGDRVLIHGSLKLAGNPWDGAMSAGCGLDLATARHALCQAVAGAVGQDLEPGSLTPTEIRAAQAIRRLRYGTDGWLLRREGPRP